MRPPAAHSRRLTESAPNGRIRTDPGFTASEGRRIAAAGGHPDARPRRRPAPQPELEAAGSDRHRLTRPLPCWRAVPVSHIAGAGTGGFAHHQRWRRVGADTRHRALRVVAARRPVAFDVEMSSSPNSVPPAVLSVLRSGSRESLDRLVPHLYEELRAIAHRQIARRSDGVTLETTGLVHEAYLRVVEQSRGAHDRAHLLALASLAMRHVLVDRARARGRLKRGGDCGRITFDEDRIVADDQPEVLLQLDAALVWLAGLDPRLARVVECRFFGGLTEEEIAEALGVTVRTVQRDWAKARMLLRRELES